MKSKLLLILLGFTFSQHFAVEIEETGESTLFIFEDSISSLDVGDELGLYDMNGIIYLLVGLVAFGNSCLLVGFVMTIEDKKEEKRKRRIKRKAKAKLKKKAAAKEKVKTERNKREVVVVEEDDIIIEEFDDDIIIE